MPPTVGPRIEFDPEHYPRIRVWDPVAKKDRFVYLHRLTAYAHGELESLWDSKIVHHVDRDRWNSRPENLKAMTREEHEWVEPHTGNLK